MRAKRKSERKMDVKMWSENPSERKCMCAYVHACVCVGRRPVLGGAVMTLSALVMSAMIHSLKIVDSAAAVADKQQI